MKTKEFQVFPTDDEKLFKLGLVITEGTQTKVLYQRKTFNRKWAEIMCMRANILLKGTSSSSAPAHEATKY